MATRLKTVSSGLGRENGGRTDSGPDVGGSCRDARTASTGEIASMIDGIVDRAEEVAAEIEAVAATEEQTATITEAE
jgi:methyl-accepting chemotaxis protein